MNHLVNGVAQDGGNKKMDRPTGRGATMLTGREIGAGRITGGAILGHPLRLLLPRALPLWCFLMPASFLMSRLLPLPWYRRVTR